MAFNVFDSASNHLIQVAADLALVDADNFAQGLREV
jgi:hypothetical protein